MDPTASPSELSSTASLTRPQALDLEPLIRQQYDLLEQQGDIFQRIVAANRAIEDKVNQWTEDAGLSTTELDVWKKAFVQEQQKCERAEQEARSLRRQIVDLQGSHDQDPIVLALINGNKYIFKDDLLKRGCEGGRDAAQILNEYIVAHLRKEDRTVSRVQVWTYFFCDLKGLEQTLVGCNACTIDEYEVFMTSFNHVNCLFTINDAPLGKVTADSKIKAHLQTWTRFPQISKVYLGGCHDNGYYSTLTELQSDGLLDKIVLFQGEQLTTQIRSLHLPMLHIDNLFQTTKVPTRGTGAKRARPSSSAGVRPKASRRGAFESPRPSDQKSVKPVFATSPMIGKPGRLLNPNLELHKQNPPPCNLFYLSTCNKGSDCKFAHDYKLEAEHLNTLKENAKKSPCPAVNTDSPCPFGEHCTLGHKCPQGPECYYHKADKCRFKGKTMHT